jgi:uncharacterized RDD family membrane protein YckC
MENVLDELQIPESEVVYATFGRRLSASLIDGIFLLLSNLAILGIFGYIILQPGDVSNTGNLEKFWTKVFSLYGLCFFTNWLYYALMESSSRQATLGKLVLGIRVAAENGNSVPTFGQATGRYFGKFISSMFLGFGFLLMLWRPKAQTLHDSISGCVVIRK